MKYFKICKQETRPGIFTCIKRKDDKGGLLDFVGQCDDDSLPFGYVRITHRNGLWMEIQRKFLEEVEAMDYLESPEFVKREVCANQ